VPGLVPGIHVLLDAEPKTWMAGKAGHDEGATRYMTFFMLSDLNPCP
jgi:hypothetical protein